MVNVPKKSKPLSFTYRVCVIECSTVGGEECRQKNHNVHMNVGLGDSETSDGCYLLPLPSSSWPLCPQPALIIAMQSQNYQTEELVHSLA
jgi:hypothetical protein